jgi:hypothetical protein
MAETTRFWSIIVWILVLPGNGGTVILSNSQYISMSTITVEFDVDMVDELALDFIERQMFYEYDACYRELTVDELPRQEEVRAFKDALEAITYVRAQISDAADAKVTRSADACAELL